MFRTAILLAQRRNMTINGKQIAYHVEETNGRDVIETLDRTCRSIAEYQILGIVGPEYSTEARTVARLGNRVGLPVVGYSTTEPELSDRNAYRTFYRLPPSEVTTARVLLKLFKKYTWNSTNVIYQGDTYGQGGLQALTEVFTDEVDISRSIRFDLFVNQFDNIKRQLEDSPSRIVIVMANANVTTQIIQFAAEAGNIMAPSFLWILTASNSSMNILANEHINQLIGMLILRLIPTDTVNISASTYLLDEALDIWEKNDPNSFHDNQRHIDIYARYAFDASWMLILAFQQLCQNNPTTCLSFENTSNCFASRLTAQKELHKILQTMSFIGLTGRVQFGLNSTDRVDDTGAYYVISNIQSSMDGLHLVDVLKLNGTVLNTNRNCTTEWTNTTNSIQWPRKWDEVPTDYALLKGKTLNITVYISPPFFMKRSSPDIHEKDLYEGYIHELITLLSEKMGFYFTYTVASDETSYDELVDCVKNRTCEIVMADLAITPARENKIDFSASIYANTMRLVVRKSKQEKIDPFAFLNPFSLALWLTIVGAIYFPSALLIAFYEHRKMNSNFEHDENNSHIYDKSWIKTIGRSLYQTIGALIQRGSELQVVTLYGRIQTVIVWLMSIILVALFTSNLIVNFTAQREKPWLQSIDDLKMCGSIGCNRIGVIERSQHEEYFTKEVTNNIPMNYHHLKHPKECFTKLVDGHIDVALTDSPTAEYMIQKEYCQLELAGTPFGRSDFGVALPKQWPYKQDLDAHILELRTNGEIDRRFAAYIQQKNCDVNYDNESKNLNNRLGVYESSGLFYIFVALTGLNFALCLLRRLFNHISKWHRGRYNVQN
ncbi:unnamed protein product [Adineta steineri]|uniref:Uncharacterized protein n=2 Tax=Adineta steineri TaxID=433720 RepID=A0A819H978_9BILA|nr:unnamed protein product [Adineta steineri]